MYGCDLMVNIDDNKNCNDDDDKTCGDCSWRPRGGAGGCRNKNNDNVKRQKRQVTWGQAACNEFFERPSGEKISKTEAKITETVDEIITLFDGRLKTMSDTRDMYIYDEQGFWKMDNNIIQVYCSERPGINTLAMKNNIKMNIEGQTFTERNKPDVYDETGLLIQRGFQTSKGFVNLLNGVLELSTMKLLPHDKKYNFKNRIEINYKPSATCHNFQNFLNAIKPDKHEQALIQEWFGYQLDDGIPAKNLYCAVGKSNSGKSTLFNIMTTLIGRDNVINQSLYNIENNNWAVAEFDGKKADIVLDMGTEELKDVGKLKSLTSPTDLNRGEKKNKDPFYFYNTCKITTTCNKLPPLSEAVEYDEAFWNRIMVDNFAVVIDVKDFGGYEHFYQSLTTPDELSGILNWAIQGLHRYNRNGKFSYDHSKSKEMWMYCSNRNNPVQRFYDEFYEQGDSSTPILKDFVWKKYLLWCEEQKISAVNRIVFGRNFSKLSGCEGSTTNITIGKDRVKVNIYAGICMKQSSNTTKKLDW